ncbi:MAG: outer membrane lipoprotein carrier protein LolA [Rhodothermales bacterium]
MKRLPASSGAALIACFVLFSVHLAASAQPAVTDILDRLQARYDEATTLQADFSQHLTTPDGEHLPGVSGSLLLRGNQYRVDTDAQTFVTDGQTTWIYNRYENQILVNDYVEDPSTFSLSDFLYAFDENYEVLETSEGYLDGIKHEILALRPRSDESFFREVTLWVRDTDSAITRLRVIDVNEAELEFSLEHLVFNPPLNGNPFDFAPPADAELIDLRSE